jgi:uncharacterized Zn finger protein
MPINEAMIRSLASSESFQRGEEYYRSGAVVDLQQRGDTLMAQVEGSSYEPYEVTIQLVNGELDEADCTCPYDWGGYCKHIVAVLLSYIRQSDQIPQRPAVGELLADLEPDELRALLSQLLADQPRLIDWIETQLALKKGPVTEESSGSAPRQRQTPIDPVPFRRQANNILGSLYGMRASEAYWHVGDISQQMSQLFKQAEPFIEAGDGPNALLILEAITEPYVDRWFEFDDEGELSGLFGEIGSLLAEAILSADLSRDERKAWVKKLTKWQKEIEDYGVDEGFDVAIAAAEQGWDDPALQKALQGHITDKGAWEGEAPWFADELTIARLNVLERQGRTSEYLHLAEAEGQTARYLTMLVKLGRGEEAVQYAGQYMASADEALALAQALREYNQPMDALKIAQAGLSLHGEPVNLARWLRDFALQVFQPDIALQAAKVAFARSPSLADYQAAEAVAGTAWPAVKSELLEQLAAKTYASDKIDIYLYEGMVDEAIKAVDHSPYIGYDALERVVEAAKQSHPDWASRAAGKPSRLWMPANRSTITTLFAGWRRPARLTPEQAEARSGAHTWKDLSPSIHAKLPCGHNWKG